MTWGSGDGVTRMRVDSRRVAGLKSLQSWRRPVQSPSAPHPPGLPDRWPVSAESHVRDARRHTGEHCAPHTCSAGGFTSHSQSA